MVGGKVEGAVDLVSTASQGHIVNLKSSDRLAWIASFTMKFNSIPWQPVFSPSREPGFTVRA